MTQTTVTYTLEEFLMRFETKIDRQFAEVNQKLAEVNQKMDRQFAEVNQKMDKQFAEVNQKMDKQFAEVNQKMDKQFAEVNQKMDKQFAEVSQSLTDLKVGQADLSAKSEGIDKRLSNVEFFNRSFLLAVIAILLGGAAKFFGIIPLAK